MGGGLSFDRFDKEVFIALPIEALNEMHQRTWRTKLDGWVFFHEPQNWRNGLQARAS